MPARTVLLTLLWSLSAAAEPVTESLLGGRSHHVGIGLDVAGATAALTTGNPYRPYSVGGGVAFAVRVGTQLGRGVGVYYVNRTPMYLFADAMPGMGVSLDCFDFNGVMLNLSVRDNLTVGLGPSFDFMVPFFGNRAFGGGLDARIEYTVARDGQQSRYTIGFDLHPSVLAYNETHGFYGYTKALLVADLSIGVQWR